MSGGSLIVMRRILLGMLFVAGIGCSNPVAVNIQVLPDYANLFPTDGLLRMDRVPAHLLEKPFMPGGNLATYQRGYQIGLGKMQDASTAAFLLLDWKKVLGNATYLAHMGGYFGTDSARPLYVFTKGPWIAVIAGLPESQADPVARTLAAHL